MAEPTIQMKNRAILIAAAIIFILFVGWFVGYRWGADAAHKANAAKPSVTAPI
ncbi:hypothetical protein [Brevundimonas guildfordensis]|uniref:Efflux transporter periplasmic adaptor subunit n=1 Tax=Brevundimonas guildfordensis TaxID=2762241 RepID=A0ABR8R3X9_9CAUL|nr:hypothetical protein [Brevundimonas guildfordensis]MBD7942485.1 hypothetical protein [Brevundimonas guildfordensis]